MELTGEPAAPSRPLSPGAPRGPIGPGGPGGPDVPAGPLEHKNESVSKINIKEIGILKQNLIGRLMTDKTWETGVSLNLSHLKFLAFMIVI